MISKQFFKVKQKYEETTGQSEKTELLTPDLNQVYKTVELMKRTFVETDKKLGKVLLTCGEDDKKGKNPKLQLGQTLMTEAEKFSSESLIHSVLSRMGQIIASLSMEQAQYEMRIVSDFKNQLINIIEQDLDSIERSRKKLSKVRFTMDTLKHRLKSSSAQATSAQKNAALEQELAEITANFESLRDAFGIEILNFISKEKKYVLLYISVIEAEREFHKNSLDILNSTLPSIKKAAESSIFQPIFGFPISDVKNIFGQDISFVLRDCAEHLLKEGLEAEGIFRLAGSTTRIKKLKASFDSGVGSLSSENPDVYSVAACMKTYLRELPEPLLTFKLESEWLAFKNLPNSEKPLHLKKLTKKLPYPNYMNLKFLIEFLTVVSCRSDVNKMTPNNLGIVIGPNLIWPKEQEQVFSYSQVSSAIVENMIVNYSTIFEGSQSFFRNPSVSSGSSSTWNESKKPLPEIPERHTRKPTVKKIYSQNSTNQ